MKTLTAAVIGLGNMGRHHAKHYQSLEGVELVAVVDPNAERREPYVGDGSCRGFSTIDDMLAVQVPDLVSVVSPTMMHFDMGRQLLAQGIHILMEKPIATTVQEAELLVREADERGLVLMVGHIERFNGAIASLKGKIEEGALGDIVSMSAQRSGPCPQQIRDANVILDVAVHDIDVLSYLAAEAPQLIESIGGRSKLHDREDYSELLVSYGSAVGHIRADWLTPIRVRTLQVVGTKGYASVDYIQQELQLYTQVSPDAAFDHEVISAPGDALREELSHFVSCVMHDRSPLVGGLDGLQALRCVNDAISRLKTPQMR